MNGVKGISFIYHKNTIKYIGKYVAGIFSDNNYEYRNDEHKGWGFKLDIYIAPLVRPVPKFWRKSFWKQKPKIRDVYDSWDFEDKEVKQKLENKRNYLHEQFPETEPIPEPHEVNDFKYGVSNPWKGEYWFVLRLPKIIPYVFFSLSLPWRSFYIGFKTSKIEPYLDKPHTTDQGDYTWCSSREVKLVKKINDRMFRSAVPSGSVRRKRT